MAGDKDPALALLRSELLLSSTELHGDVRLILQRMDQGERRTDELRDAVESLDARVDVIERTAIAREEVDQREARTHARLEQQAHRRLMIAGLVIAAASTVISTGTALLISIL